MYLRRVISDNPGGRTRTIDRQAKGCWRCTQVFITDDVGTNLKNAVTLYSMYVLLSRFITDNFNSLSTSSLQPKLCWCRLEIWRWVRVQFKQDAHAT